MDILMKNKKRSHWKLAVLSIWMVTALLSENVLGVMAGYEGSGGNIQTDSYATESIEELDAAEDSTQAADELSVWTGEQTDAEEYAEDSDFAYTENQERTEASACTEDAVEDVLSEIQETGSASEEAVSAQETDGQEKAEAYVQDGGTEIILVSEEDAFVYDGQQEYKEGWGDISEEDQILLASKKNVPQGVWISGIKDVTYTGKEIEFELNVYDENLLLTEGVDYTISYRNNISAATSDSTIPPTVIFTGIGNYKGEFQTRFTINPLAISSSEVTAENIYEYYTGEAVSPEPEILHGEKKLVNKTDYVFELKSSKNTVTEASEKGTYSLQVTGVGNYTGTRTIKFYITDAVMLSDVEVTPIDPVAYTGAAQKPEITLTYEGKKLKLKTDYIVEYKNNTDAGTATVKITGKGSYTGVRTETFEIVGISLSEIAVYDLQESYYYTGSEICPTIKLVYSTGEGATALSTILSLNRDYTVSYENNKEVGEATVNIRGKAGYSGTLAINFRIEKYDFNSEDGNLRISSEATVAYLKGGSKPSVTLTYLGKKLTKDKDYILSYTNTKEAVGTELQPTITITGIGNYTGTLTRNFIIVQQDISLLSILAPDMVYNKVENSRYQFSSPQIYDLDGKQLKKNTDYKIISYQYKNRTVLSDGTVRAAGDVVKSRDKIPVGTVLSVTLEGVNNYSGSVVAEYKIVTKDISKAKVTISQQYYTGSEIMPGKEQIAVKINNKYLRNSEYEIISYSNNIEKGTATVLLHGVGNYGGYVTGKFKIVVRDVKGNGVYFNGNGATSGKMSELRVSSLETDAVLYPNAYSRIGYDFSGWNTKADGSGTAYQDGGTISFPADKNGILITLYAQWTPYTYTISYVLNGGTNNSENPYSYQYNTGEVVFQAPVRAGYDFAGWYRTKKFKKQTEEITSGMMGNLTLYAKWKVKAPTILLSEKNETGKNRIIFSAVTGATKYAVYRSTSYNGTYKLVGTTKKTEYVDNSARNGSTYYYKIRAYSKEKSAQGYGNYSDVITITGN